MIWLLLMLGCGGDDDGPPVGTEPETGDTGQASACDELSWEGTGQPFVTTWCTACHSSQLDDGERFGAPVGFDFDTYAGVLARVDRVEATSVGESARMPPVGGADDEEKARFAEWLACGMPGPPDDDGALCADATTAAFGASVCDDGAPVRIDGDVTASGSDVSCICEVTGDLTLADGTHTWSALARVGGAFTIDGAGRVQAPLLEEAGAVRIDGASEVELPRLHTATSLWVSAPSLTLLDLHDLRTVSGSVEVMSNPALAFLDLSRLETVGGDVVIDGNPTLPTVLGELYGLRSVAGDLRIADNPGWLGFYGCGLLESVGGDVVVTGNDTFITVNGFTALTEVGGSVRIVSNPGLSILEGFDQLTTIGGELVVSGNPVLQREDAFNQLAYVGGPVAVSGNPDLAILSGLVGVEDVGGLAWVDNRSVPSLGPHTNLVRVRGDVVVRAMGIASLPGFAQLSAIDGSLVIDNNFFLESVGFTGLTTIGADFDVRNNPQLTDLEGLSGLSSVGNDVYVIDNASLSEAVVGPWLDGVTVGGTVTMTGNAP